MSTEIQRIKKLFKENSIHKNLNVKNSGTYTFNSNLKSISLKITNLLFIYMCVYIDIN